MQRNIQECNLYYHSFSVIQSLITKPWTINSQLLGRKNKARKGSQTVLSVSGAWAGFWKSIANVEFSCPALVHGEELGAAQLDVPCSVDAHRWPGGGVDKGSQSWGRGREQEEKGGGKLWSEWKKCKKLINKTVDTDVYV